MPRKFAQGLTAFGLAVAIIFGFTGNAAAAPADRSGDAVVLKGSEIARLLGADPARLVGFSFRNGRWSQIPVQVDERHTVDVRSLYPPENRTYVGDSSPDFNLEVYADPKTRSGADEDATFDANDELTFMGGDTGSRVPAGVGAPAPVVPGSGTAVRVSDPVGGGNAWVYLFRSINRKFDPSAGKDYVDYDFKLTGLTGGQTLLNDYGYFSQFNPEDSTVKTDDYELHSYDRWMEDELKIRAGNANGTDILDREVAQAGRGSCGRSEYTFSGRWGQDSTSGNDNSTDNEGTYVAVIDGPVRAIRSYMGANSGPYVQREHIYYRDHEQNTIFLRVHQMADLYTWTDFAPSAIGMTYRDAKNTAGVTVDGNPDSIAPTTSADISNGAYSWQQISGPQGTATTVMGSDTDLTDPNFGNYYLDDSTPSGPLEVQCGGDGQSIGASGFGIFGEGDTGITPNTDPRSAGFKTLTTRRTRYFGPPADGVAKAENYTARVSSPLTATSSPSPMKHGMGSARAYILTRGVTAHRGRAIRLRVKVRNSGNFRIRKAKACVFGKGLTGRPCTRVNDLGIGNERTVTLKTRVGRFAKGRKLKLSVSVTGSAGDWGFAGVGGYFLIPLRG
ncbi:MAG TPA: hypothetical protein PLS38_01175 [Solirubrobacterales bacterium]|nr:hypothetical protein [Solirubrobacterales bacterium]HNC04895.1 hypothetical protein [Solirubrobacterales bacterium]HNC14457.1 hypothetical protein [Solirubrobacterales bacterium]HNK34730.1 hypothetical protein [Solirubrobacterales bacterium]HNK65433.1 hypothetical protein [Solirubrobacterales bacterium]